MISLSSHLHFNSHMDLFNVEHYLIHHVFQEYLLDKVRECHPLRLEEELYILFNRVLKFIPLRYARQHNTI